MVARSMFKANYSKLALFCAIQAILWESTAYAYLDPGTGSMMLQALIGAIAGTIAAVSLYWRKIKSFFSKRLGRTYSDEND